MSSLSPPSSPAQGAEFALAANDNNDDVIVSEQPTTTTLLKSALWLPVGQLVDAATLSLAKNATPQFIGALTELLWHQLAEAAGDVEAFARHAGRTVITAEDVLLLARRNDGLKALLEQVLAEVRSDNEVAAAAASAAGTSKGKAGGGLGRGVGRGSGRGARARGRARGAAS